MIKPKIEIEVPQRHKTVVFDKKGKVDTGATLKANLLSNPWLLLALGVAGSLVFLQYAKAQHDTERTWGNKLFDFTADIGPMGGIQKIGGWISGKA